MTDNTGDLGKVLKRRRLLRLMSLTELASAVGVSRSYLWRIEKGERYPSGKVLRKMAQPLGFEVDELLSLAGLLPPIQSPAYQDDFGQLDPYVAMVLSQQPVEVQHTVIAVLTILKSIAKGGYHGKFAEYV